MEKVNISFAGCGFLGIYHIGVSSCIKEYAPHLLLNKIAGASVGAVAACCLMTDVSLGVFTSEMLQIITEVRKRTLGPFNPLINVQKMLGNLMELHLPENAYKKVSGRLFVSMTRVCDGSNYIESQFNSNKELIDALLASAFVPFFSGWLPPKFRDYRYIDGGFSNNLPILDENTITVSPFCGESDICPRDTTIQLFHINLCNTSLEVSKPNIDRFGRILFPPSVDVLSQMCKQGFDDALKFLQRNNMISCTKCLTVQKTISLPVIKHVRLEEHHDTFDPECEECILYKEKAQYSNLPEIVLQNFENAIERANKELNSWIKRHRTLRVLSVFSVPYFLTVDIIRAALRKFVEVTPEFLDIVSRYSDHLLRIIVNTLQRMLKTGEFLASKVFGPLSVSIYIDEQENVKRRASKTTKKLNVEFNYDPNVNLEEIDETMFKDSETLIVHPVKEAEVGHETYDHLLDVIDHHDAVMKFHYVDVSNKMNVVEFIDVTNDDQIVGKIDDSDVKIITSLAHQPDDSNADEAKMWTSKHRNVAASFADVASDDDVTSICSNSSDSSSSMMNSSQLQVQELAEVTVT